MTKRTTLILDDKVYEKLVKESMSRYGTAKNISKVVNDLVQRSGNQKDSKQELLKLIYAKKIAKTTAAEFENFRRGLSSQIEEA